MISTITSFPEHFFVVIYVSLLFRYTVYVGSPQRNRTCEITSAQSLLPMVALCSGEFKLYSDTSSITPCQFVIELHVLA